MVTKYQKPLMRFFRKNGMKDDAEDLAQEVFIRLAQNHKNMHWENPDGYIYTIASNILTDYRRRATSRHHQDHVEISLDLASKDECPEGFTLNRDQLRRALSHLKTLSPNIYHSFILHRFENMPQAQIAKKLGISISTIEKHIMTALNHLQKVMGEEKN